jgi:WD40 repeat protein
LCKDLVISENENECPALGGVEGPLGHELVKDFGEIAGNCVQGICLTPDEKWLFTGDGNGFMKCWDVKKGCLHKSWGKVHKKGITHMEITLYEVWDAQKKVFAKENVLMTAASDKILKLWHFDRDSETIALHCQTIAKSKVKFCDQMLIFEKDFSLAHPDRIQCYKMTNDGKYLYTGGSQSLVKCWETKNWTMVKDFSEYQAFKDFWVVCLNVTTEKVSFCF